MNTNLKTRIVLAIAAVACVLLILGFTGVISDTPRASAQGAAATATDMPTQTPNIVVATDEPTTPEPTWTPWIIVVTRTPMPTQTPMVVMTDTATTTPSAPATTTTPGALMNMECHADKVATYAEIKVGEQYYPQRIEATTGDVMHFEYYPQHNLKTVSILVKTGEAAVLAGFGSMWQWRTADCGSYDFDKDLSDYAMARKSWNHSGLAWDSLQAFMDGKPPKINLYNVDWTVYKPVLWSDALNAPATTPGNWPKNDQFGISNLNGTPAASTSQCGDGVRQPDQDPAVNVTRQFGPSDQYRIVNFWTNMPAHPQDERKLLLKPGENPRLYGGGGSWAWPSNCADAVQKEFDKNGNAPVTLTELDNEGLVAH